MSETVHPVPAGFKAKIGADELEALYAAAEPRSQRHWLDQATPARLVSRADGSRRLVLS